MKQNTIKLSILFTLVLCLSLVISAEGNAKTVNSMRKARNAALKQVPGANVTEIDTDTEDGMTLYEVSMLKKSKEYHLTFRASDGKLVEYEWELPNTSYSIQSRKNISRSKIKRAAQKLIKQSRIRSIRLVTDDGLSEYKLTLSKANRQYKLIYNAKNGKLLEYSWKLASSKSTSSSKYISSARAKSIALKKAPGAAVIKTELDDDDGTAVYEIELRKGSYEYDITINAKTGAVLEFDKELDD